MPKQEQLGDRLAQLRREKAAAERRDINAQDVARIVGVSQPTYSRYEANITKPDDETLGALAEYFGVTRSWLRYGEGERHSVPRQQVTDQPAHETPMQPPGTAPVRAKAAGERPGRHGHAK